MAWTYSAVRRLASLVGVAFPIRGSKLLVVLVARTYWAATILSRLQFWFVVAHYLSQKVGHFNLLSLSEEVARR